jgi:hypothetical protein
MTQVLTALMISHMFLNLKDINSRVQDKSSDLVLGSFSKRDKSYQTSASLGAWFVGQKTTTSVVGTLGNDLVHSSILDY